jgi:hypothetical protein
LRSEFEDESAAFYPGRQQYTAARKRPAQLKNLTPSLLTADRRSNEGTVQEK